MDINRLGLIRKRCLFFGEIQGVGFRFFVKSQAKKFYLTGFVENLPDGSVEMEVQGEGKKVNQMIASILHSNFKITDLEVDEIPVKKEKAFYAEYE